MCAPGVVRRPVGDGRCRYSRKRVLRMAQNKRRLALVVALLAVILASATAAWAASHQYRRSGEPDAEEVEAVSAAPNSSTGSCGVERWSVKTGTDADAGAITL